MDSKFTIGKEHVIKDLKSTDRFSAFEEIIAHLVKTKTVPYASHQEVLKTLCSREEKTTFAVGRHIAIPHINGTTVVKECTFLYARSREGIEFGSCDTGLVHHIFLALIPEDKKGGWLMSLSQIAKSLSCAELRQQLQDAKKEEPIRKLLNEKLSEIIKP